jgi:hypothetical protein
MVITNLSTITPIMVVDLTILEVEVIVEVVIEAEVVVTMEEELYNAKSAINQGMMLVTATTGLILHPMEMEALLCLKMFGYRMLCVHLNTISQDLSFHHNLAIQDLKHLKPTWLEMNPLLLAHTTLAGIQILVLLTMSHLMQLT